MIEVVARVIGAIAEFVVDRWFMGFARERPASPPPAGPRPLTPVEQEAALRRRADRLAAKWAEMGAESPKASASGTVDGRPTAGWLIADRLAEHPPGREG